ncbi:pilus assembly protein TadG-related protein, partial [Rubellimicrobium roseum]
MRRFRDLRQDEEGTFIVFFALALAALLGMIALSFDLGRVASTQAELQSFADNVALAAAGELDGGSDAITRAQAA